MKFMRRVIGLSAMLALFAASAPAFSATESPEALVKRSVDEVLGVIKQNPDRQKVRQLAEQKVLPYFDFQAMTRLAVGRGWRDATPEQQKRLEQAFRSLLVNTYTAALTQAVSKDQTVEVKPPQGGAAAETEVTVKTVVRDPAKPQPIAIDYRMENTPQGWKVFDVIVENVSLVTTYRGTFQQEVSRGGIDGLIKSLEDKNRTVARG
jgi:phospholipid transport system substrate-binding protein